MVGGLLQIRGNGLAVAVLVAELPMGAGQALGCRLPVECVGAGKVGRGGGLVILGEVVLRFGVALGGGLFGPMQGGRMVMVVVVAHQADLGGQKALLGQLCVFGQQAAYRLTFVLAQLQQVVAGIGVVGSGSFLQPAFGSRVINHGAVAVEIATGQLEGGFGMTFACGLSK